MSHNHIFTNANRYASVLFTVGLIAFCEMFVTVEWSSPYCTNPSDGPAYAAFGVPLPYWQFNGVSSGQYDLMPQIYFFNILVLCALFFPFIRWFMKRYLTTINDKYRTLLGFTGLGMILYRAALFILLFSTGANHPTLTIGSSYEPYFDLRPIKFIYSDGHYSCTPSDYWFPDGWKNE